MRRLWPSSLLGQILLAAALALLAVQLINAAVQVRIIQKRLAAEASWMVSSITARSLERERNGRQFYTPPVVRITRSSEALMPAAFRQDDELVEMVSEHLKSVSPQIELVKLSIGPLSALPATLHPQKVYRGNRGIDDPIMRGRSRTVVLLNLRLQNGQWVNAVGVIRPYRFSPFGGLIAETILLYLAVLIPLALITRRITEPLQSLTARVHESGLAADIEPLQPQGPSDVRELIEAFNSAQSRLNALLTEKDVMLGAIGHDLKTPLASLRVRIENVDDDAERAKMVASVEEMVTILDDILTLARLGRSAEAVQPTELNALIETLLADFPDDTIIDFEPFGERLVVPIRPVLIRRALRNLVSNALQYGGSAEISIQPHRASIWIAVDDNGPGIAPEEIEGLFEPFSRLESSRNRSSGGSGLGLTIARAIARTHGGDVTLQNRPEGGIRATFSVPKA